MSCASLLLGRLTEPANHDRAARLLDRTIGAGQRRRLDNAAQAVQLRGCMGKTTLLGQVATVTGLLQKLRDAAKAKKTTLAKVAETVGVTRQYLERVTAEGTMPAELYISVCTELGIDPSQHAKLTQTTRTLIGKKP